MKLPKAASGSRGNFKKDDPADPRLWRSLLKLVLVLITVAVFLPALRSRFIDYDDPDYIILNVHVVTGLSWDNIKWAFTSMDASNWHPLTWISHMLDCELFGLYPFGHHAVNVVLHSLNATLVFIVFARMTGATWRSFLLALIFAIHPLRVESVAWASERKDVLSGFFWLLTMYCYCRYVEAVKEKAKSKRGLYALTLIFFACGLMSKPSVVTLPFVLLLLDYWPFKRNISAKLVVEKIPFFVLTFISCIVTSLAQKTAILPFKKLPLDLRLENVCVAYADYLSKMFWPTNLSVLYPLPDHLPFLKVIACGCLLVAISIAAFVLKRQRPYLLVGWCWFLGVLVPMIGLVQVGSQAFADRYTYLSAIGIGIMLAWSIPNLAGWLRTGVVAAAAALILISCAITRRQIDFWQNSENLFRHALASGGEDSYQIHGYLGNALTTEGHPEEGAAELRKAIQLKPDVPLLHERLGMALHSSGKLAEAKAQFDEILKNDATNSATTLNELGSVLYDQGQVADAMQHYEMSLKLNPNLAPTHYNLGMAFNGKGDYAAAADEFQRAVSINPGYAPAHYQFGLACFNAGRMDDAIREISFALALAPNFAKWHFSLGEALVKANRSDDAVSEFRTALDLQTNYPEAARELQKLNAKP
ncbi:MAG TPA: tetratricopeptide repeat protein [Verrucomicrobiae bacterium]|jgi:tetratricopeptide (TPR) repeat protein|nr:tetratricopeptide repeat protein [Verrucomicrobiae bacterium]